MAAYQEAGFLSNLAWLWRIWVALQLAEEGGEAIEAWPQIPQTTEQPNVFVEPQQPAQAGPAPIGSDIWMEELDWLETEGLGPYRDRRRPRFCLCR